MDTDAFLDHLFDSALGAFDTLSVYIGDQLGLYEALRQHGALTADGLAKHTGMHPRYAREWLEQQSVAGILTVEDAAVHADDRRFVLPAEHAAVLADRDSLTFFAPFARIIGAAAIQLPALLEAYRTGGGVGWSEYGEAMRTGQADANRPLFLHALGTDWLPSLPDVHRRLSDGGRVADVGCGDGWSSVGIALAYPEATVDGFDLDEASVRAATGHAASYGLADRVRFQAVDAGTVAQGDYDLVTAFECVHDLADPVGVLAGMRRLVKPGGTVLVMDERVPEEFTGPGDPVEQLMYGMSLLICLPDGMSHDGSRATGTVMRPATLRGYAREAGFSDVEVLPIENDLFRFDRLVA
ncbi:MAG TPA: class I SAM-dependent methyltransferase [Nocardioidaceae bacterium]|nr:class I SAM-dependent methyltransferase [Nocardioidaceae bacterium]